MTDMKKIEQLASEKEDELLRKEKVEVLVRAVMNAEDELSDGYHYYMWCHVNQVEDRIRAWAEQVVSEMEAVDEQDMASK